MELVRGERAVAHLSTFVVAAVATVLVTRAFLALAGYPRIGGDSGLHIAHVLPGGLLMLAGTVLLLGYIGPGPEPAAAVVGGIGFGLFIDEVGKFVTADNDYFYEPAAAIMYVVFAVIVLSARRWRGSRLTPAERAANVAVIAVDGVAGRMSRARQEEALAQLRALGDDVPGVRELDQLLRALPARHVPLPARVERAGAWVLGVLHHVATSRWAVPVMAALLAGQAVAASAVAAALWGASGTGLVPLVGVLVGTATSLGFTVRGLVLLPRSRLRAVESFRRSAQVSLLLTQVFLFAVSEFGAVGGLLIDLVLLGVVSADLARMRHERAHAEAERAADPSTPLSAAAGAVPGSATAARPGHRMA
jgi:hypothetical protein